jgi:hypothetical protein
MIQKEHSENNLFKRLTRNTRYVGAFEDAKGIQEAIITSGRREKADRADGPVRVGGVHG